MSRQVCLIKLHCDAYRPIIHQSYFHHSLKAAILNPLWLVPLLHFFHKCVIQSLCLLWIGSPMEVRLCAFLGFRQECEL